jgi:hypothetical protein
MSVDPSSILPNSHHCATATNFAQSEGPDLGLGDGVDPITFGQILEMDDNDERDFSKSLVLDFLDQAKQTFTQMHKAL